MAAYQQHFFIFVIILEGFCRCDNFSRFRPRLYVKLPSCRALFFLSATTFGDRIEALVETVDIFLLGVPTRLIINILIEISQSTVRLVVFSSAALAVNFTLNY